MQTLQKLSHSGLRHLIKLRSSAKYRQEKQSTFCRGRSIAMELLEKQGQHISRREESKTPIRSVVLTSQMSPAAVNQVLSQVEALPKHVRPNVYVLNEMKKLTNTPQVGDEEVVCEVGIPAEDDILGKIGNNRVHYILVLDGIQDPINVGLLVRSALFLGWEGVIAVNGHASFFNDKVIRASMGAVFHIPLQTCEHIDALANTLSNTDTFVALTPPESITLKTSIPGTKQTPRILVLGNETAGICWQLRRSGRPIMIPRQSQVLSYHFDSLNVNAAGSVLLHHLGPSQGSLQTY